MNYSRQPGQKRLLTLLTRVLPCAEFCCTVSSLGLGGTLVPREASVLSDFTRVNLSLSSLDVEIAWGWEAWGGYKSYCRLRGRDRRKGEPLGASMTLIRIATQKTAAQICSITVVLFVCVWYMCMCMQAYTHVQAYILVYVYEDTCLASSSIAFNLTCSHPEPEDHHFSWTG